MQYLGRIVVQLPSYLTENQIREILFGSMPEGCVVAKLVAKAPSSELPSVILYSLKVEDGRERDWKNHLTAKDPGIIVYIFPKDKERRRVPYHKQPQFH